MANVHSGLKKLKNGVCLHESGQGFVRLFMPFSFGDGADFSQGVGNGRLEASPIEGKDEKSGLEYVEYKFRMLSKSYIPGYGLDFSEGDVLKKSLSKFKTKLFRNHKTKIEESLGVTHSPVWSSSRGVEGVDATYRIFKKFGSDVVDRLNVGVLDSTSVGIEFLWRKSHPNLDGYSFHDSLGKTVGDQIVRMVITKILRIREASIVYAGADENAKRLSLSDFSGDSAQQ